MSKGDRRSKNRSSENTKDKWHCSNGGSVNNINMNDADDDRDADDGNDCCINGHYECAAAHNYHQ